MQKLFKIYIWKVGKKTTIKSQYAHDVVLTLILTLFRRRQRCTNVETMSCAYRDKAKYFQ